MAAERITHNPRLETIPDHAGPHYNPIRALLIATGMTEEEVELFNTTWTRIHEERI